MKTMANLSSSTHLQIFAPEAEIKLDINEADGCFMSCLLRGKRRRCIKRICHVAILIIIILLEQHFFMESKKVKCVWMRERSADCGESPT